MEDIIAIKGSCYSTNPKFSNPNKISGEPTKSIANFVTRTREMVKESTFSDSSEGLRDVSKLAIENLSNGIHRRIDTNDNPPAEQSSSRKPVGMSRAKGWSLAVENAFRLQLAGFRDLEEYLSFFPEPQRWEDSGFMRCLQSKKTGYFMYFRRHRECADKHINKIKLYTY